MLIHHREWMTNPGARCLPGPVLEQLRVQGFYILCIDSLSIGPLFEMCFANPLFSLDETPTPLPEGDSWYLTQHTTVRLKPKPLLKILEVLEVLEVP